MAQVEEALHSVSSPGFDNVTPELSFPSPTLSKSPSSKTTGSVKGHLGCCNGEAHPNKTISLSRGPVIPEVQGLVQAAIIVLLGSGWSLAIPCLSFSVYPISQTD